MGIFKSLQRHLHHLLKRNKKKVGEQPELLPIHRQALLDDNGDLWPQSQPAQAHRVGPPWVIGSIDIVEIDIVTTSMAGPVNLMFRGPIGYKIPEEDNLTIITNESVTRFGKIDLK